MDPLAMLTSLLRKSPAGDRVILELDLDHSVLSNAPANPLEAFRLINAPTMRALRDGLAEAAADPAVAGLIVHLGTCPISASQCCELADLIAGFAEHKPVWAYTESFGEFSGGLLPYTLAAHAEQVWLQPSGELGLGGLRAQITLLRGVFDKVGLEPQFGQRKEYKTAADTYAAHEISPANTEMMQQIVNSITHWAVDTIAQRRGRSAEQVWASVDAGMLTAEQAREHGLIDRIGYRDEVYAEARRAWAGETASLRFVHRYSKVSAAKELVQARLKPAVAMVEVRGGIVTGRPPRQGGGQPVAASEVVCQQLRAAAADDQVKAVVLRVDSPGGSYIASDAIRREVLRLRESGRPVVACMGDVAASGGYFVAMPADEIVAQPTTLTGSIGVLAGKFVSTGIKEKLGLVMSDVTAGAWASFMSPNSRFSDEQWAALDRRLDDIYADFTGKAAADRGMALDVLEPLAHGRVWTGLDAKQRGLIDHLGGMGTAIDRACALAGLRRDEVAARAVSMLGFLKQLRPAESSESVSGAVTFAPARLDLDTLIADAASRLGLTAHGVLSLPFAIRLDGGLGG
ncbi:MAG: signal peptide peptidase SppA [Micropruina sp.]|uniref:signal peptide peptidase SppA n=1 Tax=Micropruina sp. TaxID=2737536 RepID=UPI0039E52A06